MSESKSKLRKVTRLDITHIEVAIADLKSARDCLVNAGAKAATRKVRSALKSAEGALRHAQRCYDAAYYEERRAAESVDHEVVVVVKDEAGR